MPSTQPRPCPDPDADALGAMQHALHRVMKSLVFRGDLNSPINALPLTQLKCLFVIGMEEGLKMLDVSQRLEVKLPALSQIVDRLVKRGMVERRADPNDRRVVRLGLTDAARAILNEANAARQARMEAVAAHLAPDAMQEVLRGLRRLADASERVEAEERQAAPPFSPDPDPLMELMSRRERARLQNTAPGLSPTASKDSQ